MPARDPEAAVDRVAAALDQLAARMNAVSLRGAARTLRSRPHLDPGGALARQLDACADALLGDGVVDAVVVDEPLRIEAADGSVYEFAGGPCRVSVGEAPCRLSAGHAGPCAVTVDR